ncbi:type VII secretion system-associated protein [Streptomyces sp. TRM 70361]|uniref:type VII secretion system-associated protein n=1 Tax=Streptomyces sp. TRM 70361 TaxID=3116553 RepID=UPI002E7BA228|nr:type VII secretion system-associated protein [Streptomyces sp. TRM 70361]MEE1940105.1 type VII secretion system-associated protein [Streptomyces sp. TRM 70361]
MNDEDADRVTSALLGQAAKEPVGQHRSADASAKDRESRERDAAVPAGGDGRDRAVTGEAPPSADTAPGEEASDGGARPAPEGMLPEGGLRSFSAEEPPEEDIPPPPHIVELARVAPGNAFFITDPTWQGEGTPPAWAVVGRWNSDERGEVTGWEDNDEYRPSPRALGWPRPADEADAAAQLAVTGYGPMADVPRALAAVAEVAVILEDDGTPALATVPDGTTAVPVFTVPPRQAAADPADADLPAHRTVPVADLPGVVGERPLLYLSTTAPVSVVVEVDDVLAGDGGQTVPTAADTPAPPDVPASRQAAGT